MTVSDDGVGRLSPLGHDHTNLLGHYQFSATNLTDSSFARCTTAVPDI